MNTVLKFLFMGLLCRFNWLQEAALETRSLTFWPCCAKFLRFLRFSLRSAKESSRKKKKKKKPAKILPAKIYFTFELYKHRLLHVI